MEEYIKELDQLFRELKTVSITSKLPGGTRNSGDVKENPLEKQFNVILTKIEDKLLETTKEDENYTKLLCFKASMLYEKAKIYLSENLLEECKETLEMGINSVSEVVENDKIVFIYLRLTNHLAYVLSRMGDLQRAKQLLEKIVQCGKMTPSPEIYSTEDLFSLTNTYEKFSEQKYDKLILNNMQMLAWIYGRLGSVDEHVIMQHEVLQKQFEYAEGDALQWAQSCFRITGLYLAQKKWKAARYHLAAAEAVLNPLEISMMQSSDLFKTQADLARTWIYYGLQLFEASSREKHLLLEQAALKCEVNKLDDTKSEEIPNELEDEAPCEFEGLDIKVPTQVPVVILKNIQDAMALFTHTQKWLKRSRLYYTLRDAPLQYINTCLDQSELYRFLASYYQDYDAQYNVQRKRYEALETLCTILKEVRPQYYVAVYIELMREIVEVQAELMNLNLLRMYKPTEAMHPNLVTEDLLRKKINAAVNIHIKLGCLQDTIEHGSDANRQKKGEGVNVGNADPAVEDKTGSCVSGVNCN